MSELTEKLKSTLGRFGEGENKGSITQKLKSTLGKIGEGDKGNITEMLKSTFGRVGEGAKKKAKQFKDNLGEAAHGLAKEAKVTPALHEHSMGVLRKVRAEDKRLKKMLDDAYAFAVFPNVARAGLVIGVSYGKGEVFEKGNVVGYAGMAQVTAGVHLGGQTYHMLVIMNDPEALKYFKSGKTNFAANASVAFVKGAMAGRSPPGLRIYLHSEGGETLELALGGQKIKFVPAGLGRLRKADLGKGEGEGEQEAEQEAEQEGEQKGKRRLQADGKHRAQAPKRRARAGGRQTGHKVAHGHSRGGHAATRH